MSGVIELPPGSVIGRDFRVVRPLAEGGMGMVYQAEQLSTGKPRALKVMLPQCVRDPRTRERFAQEARAGARIASDHVVEVVGSGVDEATGLPWLAMELLEGTTLDAALAQRQRFSPADTAQVFAQLGHALTAAHAVGIVHRDLKPENLFLVSARRADVQFTVKVLDFGIAKLVQESQLRAANTQAMGSPLWMSPEQTAQGLSISPATDIWPLGLLAFLLLTGVSYWRAARSTDTGVMAFLRELMVEPLAPASVRAAEMGLGQCLPPGFDPWFARCVNRDPSQRFQQAAQATTSLQTLLLGAHAAVTTESAYAPTGQQPVTPAQGYPPTGLAPTPTLPSNPGGTQAMPVPMGTPPPAWGPYAPPVLQPAPPVRVGVSRGWFVAVGLVTALVLAGGAVALVVQLSPDPNAPDGPVSPPLHPVSPVDPTPTPPVNPPPVNPPTVPTGPVLVPIPAPPLPQHLDDPSGPGTRESLGDMPFRAGQRWVGTYTCRQGPTRATLEITGADDRRVDAMFLFQYPATATSGSYTMAGVYSPGPRRLPLQPGAWMIQPPGYIPVAMDGTVSADGSTYAGRMLDPTCQDFTLRRVVY